MRIRSKTRPGLSYSPFEYEYSRVFDHPDAQYLNFRSHTDSVAHTTFDYENSTMEDKISPRLPTGINPITRKASRLRLGHKLAIKPVRPCNHSTTKLSFEKDIQIVWGKKFGSGFFSRLDTYTYRFPESSSLLSTCANNVHIINNFFNSKAYTASSFREHDWFSLTSDFDEACNSFLPSSFLLGESMYESSIFLDAFRIIVNPTNAVRVLIRAADRFVKRSRTRNLGQVARDLAKVSASGTLGYSFGVRPAINDVIHTLSAHQSVSKRMAYLRDHQGGWVPVRVRRVIPSSVSNEPPGSNDPSTDQLSWYCLCADKSNQATISSLARVRHDLTFGDEWSAYLQYFGINKVVGLAWELIPFSFVVDWFTNAQERINYYTRLRTGGPFNEFRDFCWSEKKSLREILYVNPGWRSVQSDIPMISPSKPFAVASKTTTNYTRSLVSPTTSGVVDLSTLGAFHSLHGAALLIQRYLK